MGKEQETPETDTYRTGLAMWVVCFVDTMGPIEWWDRVFFTKKPFRHCYCMQYQKDVDRWILIDWRHAVVDFAILEPHEINAIFDHVKSCGGVMLSYIPDGKEEPGFWRFPLLYCVSAALHTLRWKTRWTWTPYQLYKRMKRAGAKTIADYRETEDEQNV